MASAVELLLLAMSASSAQVGGAFKQSTQSIASSVTLTSDSALTFPVTTGTSYSFLSFVLATGATLGSGDIRIGYSAPSGSTITWGGSGWNVSGGSATVINWGSTRTASPAFQAYGCNGSNANWIITAGSLVTATAGGSLTMQWCQNTSTSTATNVLAGSWLAVLQWP